MKVLFKKENVGKMVLFGAAFLGLCMMIFVVNLIFGQNVRVDADQTTTTICAETFRGATQQIDNCSVEIKYTENSLVCFTISATEDSALSITHLGKISIPAKKKIDVKIPLSNEKNNAILIEGDTVIAKYNFGGWKNRGLVPHPEGIINGKSEVEIFNNSVISTPGFDATYMSMEKYGGYKVTVRLGNITEEINEISAVQYFTKDEETYSMPVGEIERINLVNGTVDFVFHTEYFGADYQHDLHVLINGRTIVVKNYAKV